MVNVRVKFFFRSFYFDSLFEFVLLLCIHPFFGGFKKKNVEKSFLVSGFSNNQHSKHAQSWYKRNKFSLKRIYRQRNQAETGDKIKEKRTEENVESKETKIKKKT